MADPILNDLDELFADIITIEPYTGSDSMGDPTYGSATTWKAKVRSHNMLVRDPGGREVISTVSVNIKGCPNLSIFDKVTLPADFTPRTPDIISIEKHRDENGPHHEKVFFK